MMGPHYISPKPNEARARLSLKPVGFFESPIRLDIKDQAITQGLRAVDVAGKLPVTLYRPRNFEGDILLDVTGRLHILAY